MGNISQADIVEQAASRNEETFKRQTGITSSRLIRDKVNHDTKASFYERATNCMPQSPQCIAALLSQASYVQDTVMQQCLLSLVLAQWSDTHPSSTT